MTLRLSPTNRACGMVVWTPTSGELSLKDENKQMLCKKSRLKNSLKKAERNENIQMEPGYAWRFQITKTMKSM